ncbi:multiple sugar transport system ATP-binding protein [Herbaspirillum sp. 1173]|uniref:ABC transporter ATP-binding protein n=1 Tax=Herbaspirillum sp. 1173 TaxID=2817734 RepID=UPI002858B272|nr:sn-glycerol-3-phosphate ABC transporter ATP-binding protein UgpC [Herbaspirillum sp. 1173]MDR6743321.1 multiple sugar transport system ATP-binding protein [Herbaspirillum sp. 1173]
MANLRLRAVGKSYDGQEAIKGIDLEVKHGEFVVFIGPSGCGKTTLLRMIAGLEDISEGDLLIDGKRMNDIAPSKRELAMVFQSYALYPHMTVADNMGLALKLAGVSKPERQKKIVKAAKVLQLERYLERKPGQLSGGQRQRVAIGRSIVRSPKIFLFDEPLSNLDAALRGQMRVELADLHKKLGATMIYVTHDQVEAMTMADKIVVLNNGEVQQIGSPLELYHQPRNLFVATFLGSPRMNLVQANVRTTTADGLVVSAAQGIEICLPAEGNGVSIGEKVTLGVRAEHIRFDASGALSGKILFAERLGSLTLVHVELPSGEKLVVQTDGSYVSATGDNVRMSMLADHMHVFKADCSALKRLAAASKAA